MQLPLQITFRDMDASPALEQKIRDKVARLERLHPEIISCRVIVEPDFRRHQKGNHFRVRIDLGVPSRELVAGREPPQHQAHQDPYVAVRDAFAAIEKQLDSYVQRRRGDVKRHQTPPHGHVAALGDDHGTIQTSDGRSVYFHRHSVLDEDFDALNLGDEVRYAEERGDEGPQASTVKTIGKHHLRE